MAAIFYANALSQPRTRIASDRTEERTLQAAKLFLSAKVAELLRIAYLLKPFFL